jgi:alpha-glucosidase
VIVEDEVGYHWQHYLMKGGKIVYVSKKKQEERSIMDWEINRRLYVSMGKDLKTMARMLMPTEQVAILSTKIFPFYYGLHHGKAYGIFFDNTLRNDL